MTTPLDYLKSINTDLANIPYEQIYEQIAAIRYKMLPSGLLKKGHFIDRVRINEPGEIFTNSDEVSYIHDKEKLEKYIGYGRSNIPGQAVFYGSVMSKKMERPREVAFKETSYNYRIREKLENISEVFTMSRWRILENIEVLEMIFSDAALAESEYVQLSLQNQRKHYQHLEQAGFMEDQARFFSNEFSRNDINKGEEYKYKISAAYINYIWNKSHLKGITYPSVQTGFLGQNVALLPEVVDKYLKLESVGMFSFEKKSGLYIPIDSIKIATDLGVNQSDFQWYDYIGSEH
ncbi:MAG: hypothetical protein JWR09_5202 [Mucilaginibacter sp.]|nr:hypothetical protein [Mucilaginibacter sp.]